MPNSSEIEKLIEGEIRIPVPRIMFKREETSYDLLFEPIDDMNIKVHINAHFKKGEFPNEVEFKDQFVKEFQSFLAILDKLLKE